jgi:transcriptional regulator with XRE-family HTH domain
MVKLAYTDPMMNWKICKTARELLDLEQVDLAELSGIGLSTIRDFERRIREPSKRTLDAVKDAFLKEGLEITLSEKRITLSVERARIDDSLVGVKPKEE